MKKYNKLMGALLALSLFFAACSATKSSRATDQELAQLRTLVNNRSIEVTSDWAMPLTTNALNQIGNSGLFPPGSNASRINLIGNPNFLRIQGDSVSAQLPYYGERQVGSTYGNQNTGIHFEGVPEDFKVVKNEKKQTYIISFDISKATENYQVNLTLRPDFSTLINVNSNQRFNIAYQGSANAIEQE